MKKMRKNKKPLVVSCKMAGVKDNHVLFMTVCLRRLPEEILLARFRTDSALY